MTEIDLQAEIKYQEEQLKTVIADLNTKLNLKVKIEGALEILKAFEQSAKAKVDKIATEAKAVEAEVVEEIKKVI